MQHARREDAQHGVEVGIRLSYHAEHVCHMHTKVSKAQQHPKAQSKPKPEGTRSRLRAKIDTLLIFHYHPNRFALVRMSWVPELHILASRYCPRSPKLGLRSRGRLGSRLRNEP
jgi:hypothetical protein